MVGFGFVRRVALARCHLSSANRAHNYERREKISRTTREMPRDPTWLKLRECSPLMHTDLDHEIQAFCRKEQLDDAFRALSFMDQRCSNNAYMSLLKECRRTKALRHAIQVREHLCRHSVHVAGVLGEYIVITLAQCGGIDDAFHVLFALPQRTVLSWTAIISAYVDCGCASEALQMYHHMKMDGVDPNCYTFVSLLKACGSIANLEEGRKVHAEAQIKGGALDIFVGNSLLSMYGKCGSILDAEGVFCWLCVRDVISWSVMLSAYCDKGLGVNAMLLYRQILAEQVATDGLALNVAIQACCTLAEKEAAMLLDGRVIKLGALQIGWALHSDARKHGLSSDILIGSTLLRMYGKCGSVLDVENVFNGLVQHDVVSWSLLISAYVEQGQAKTALQLFRLMQLERVSPDEHAFAIAVQACSIFADCGAVAEVEHLHKTISCFVGRSLQEDARKRGSISNTFVANALLNLYIKSGSIGEAESLFFELWSRDVVSWTVMLSAYVEMGDVEKALLLYRQMLDEGGYPDEQTFVTVMNACGTLAKDFSAWGPQSSKQAILDVGQTLHADVRRQGYLSSRYVCNTLAVMYVKCGSIVDAENIFGRLSQPDNISWYVMLSAYAELKEEAEVLRLYRVMQEEGVSPNENILLLALQACCILAEKDECLTANGESSSLTALKIVRALQADAQTKGFSMDTFFESINLNVYVKCGRIGEAENIFCGLLRLEIVSWNVMLSMYNEADQGERSLLLFRQMREEGVRPNVTTFVLALQACCNLIKEHSFCGVQIGKEISLNVGRALRADACKEGFACNAYICSALVNIYGKCGAITEAESVFCSIVHHDKISWTVMICAYIGQAGEEKGLQTYRQMQEEGVSVDERTMVGCLHACCALAAEEDVVAKGNPAKLVPLEIGRALHADAQRKGLMGDVFLANLLSVYIKCDSVVEAENLFHNLPQCYVLSWNAMLALYVDQSQGDKALRIYRQMLKEYVPLDDISFASILQACIETGDTEVCRQLHFGIVFAGFDTNTLLLTTLVCAYESCVDMVDAQAVFDACSHHDVAAWNACIAGYAREANYVECALKVEEMQLAGAVPNQTTFLSILSACSHVGLVNKGVKYFKGMISDFGVALDMKLYAGMVDIFGRAGDFERVENMILQMPMQSDMAVWSCLLSACRIHGNIDLAKYIFGQVVHAQPKDGAVYVMMSNICAGGGDWLRGTANEVEIYT